MANHASIYPAPEELEAVQTLVSTVEGALKKVSDWMDGLNKSSGKISTSNEAADNTVEEDAAETTYVPVLFSANVCTMMNKSSDLLVILFFPQNISALSTAQYFIRGQFCIGLLSGHVFRAQDEMNLFLIAVYFLFPRHSARSFLLIKLCSAVNLHLCYTCDWVIKQAQQTAMNSQHLARSLNSHMVVFWEQRIFCSGAVQVL